MVTSLPTLLYSTESMKVRINKRPRPLAFSRFSGSVGSGRDVWIESGALIAHHKGGILARELGLHVDHAVAKRSGAQPFGHQLAIQFAVPRALGRIDFEVAVEQGIVDRLFQGDTHADTARLVARPRWRGSSDADS